MFTWYDGNREKPALSIYRRRAVGDQERLHQLPEDKHSDSFFHIFLSHLES